MSAYERGRLAHPTMKGPEEDPARSHVYAIQEGAVGGEGSQGSGCGCN